jgi:hypothetical protein
MYKNLMITFVLVSATAFLAQPETVSSRRQQANNLNSLLADGYINLSQNEDNSNIFKTLEVVFQPDQTTH